MSGAWHNNKSSNLHWRTSSSGMYLLLSSSPALRSCSPSLQVIGEVIFDSSVQPGVLIFLVRTIFISFRLARLCFRDLGWLSLRLFVCDIALAAYLFYVAETKFYQVILWRVYFTFSPNGSFKRSLPANSGIPRSRFGVTGRYVAPVPARGSPEYSS